MAVFIVTYDLDAPGQDYAGLIAQLKSVGGVVYQKSAWLIDVNQNAEEVRDAIMSWTDANDRVFVAEIAGDYAWAGYRMMGHSGQWLLNRRP